MFLKKVALPLIDHKNLKLKRTGIAYVDVFLQKINKLINLTKIFFCNSTSSYHYSNQYRTNQIVIDSGIN